jgi:HPt (histidine-containing phosphotransfer) domain-containing protein
MSDDEEMDAVIAGLRAQFRARLKADAATIRDAVRELAQDGTVDERRAALKRLLSAAHRLSGSAASFGFEAIGNAATPIEEMLRAVLAAGGALALPATLQPQVSDLVALCDAVKGEEDSPQRQ